jgi:hypothetical protein
MRLTRYNTLNGFPMFIAVLAMILGSFLTACAAVDSKGSADQTSIYFLRHAEIDKSTKDKPLNAKGKARAQVLVGHFQGKRITHIYATHNDRTNDTLVPLAKERGMAVEQIPAPGSVINGEIVTNRTKGKVAIKPVVKALRNLPEGSSAVVAANSGNLYAIMAGLGVPIRESCKNSTSGCLPCKSKKCFPKKQFNNIWTVTLTGDKAIMTHSTYGK